LQIGNVYHEGKLKKKTIWKAVKIASSTIRSDQVRQKKIK
jgi:hypothetical protein